MFFSGESNVPGAPGNLLAGSPGYRLSEDEIQDRLFQYGMQNTERGRQIQRNIDKLREQYPHIFNRQNLEAVQPGGSSNLPGAIGNMAGLANAQFYGGPQMGQAPPGFQAKYVS